MKHFFLLIKDTINGNYLIILSNVGDEWNLIMFFKYDALPIINIGSYLAV